MHVMKRYQALLSYLVPVLCKSYSHIGGRVTSDRMSPPRPGTYIAQHIINIRMQSQLQVVVVQMCNLR